MMATGRDALVSELTRRPSLAVFAAKKNWILLAVAQVRVLRALFNVHAHLPHIRL